MSLPSRDGHKSSRSKKKKHRKSKKRSSSAADLSDDRGDFDDQPADDDAESAAAGAAAAWYTDEDAAAAELEARSRPPKRARKSSTSVHTLLTVKASRPTHSLQHSQLTALSFSLVRCDAVSLCCSGPSKSSSQKKDGEQDE